MLAEKRHPRIENLLFMRFDPHSDHHGLLPKVVKAYQMVFADEPWNEWYKCSSCERHWGKKHRVELESSQYRCLECGLDLVEYWPADVVEKDLLLETKKDSTHNPSCWIAVEYILDEIYVIGFCWGYVIDADALEQKLELGGLSQVLKNRYGQDSLIAYQDEVGVVSRHRKKGLARELISRRLRDFRNMGARVGVTRTMSNPPSVTYSWYTNIGYEEVAHYGDERGRVVIARTLHDLII